METKILKANKKNIELVAQEIIDGKLVAFATETVYGLGANALNDQAVSSIFKVKGRPADNPLIVHLGNKKDISKFAVVTKSAKKAIKKFMPGALTIILKSKGEIAPSVTCGLDTVGIRIPKNKSAIKLLKACKLPVSAPSANSSTKPSPTLATHVFDDLNGKIEYILDGGQCAIGVESTILDFSGDEIRLLRKGGIELEKLERVLGKISVDAGIVDAHVKPISPGQKYLHYAPKAEVFTFDFGDFKEFDRILGENRGKKTVILCLNPIFNGNLDHKLNVNLESVDGVSVIKFKNPKEYAKRLFLCFRQADKAGAEVIICEKPTEEGIGSAINNRLSKASKNVKGG